MTTLVTVLLMALAHAPLTAWGAWVEEYETTAACVDSATNPTKNNYDGLADGVCYSYSGPHGSAMKLDCASNSLVEFAANTSCDGAALATYTGTQGNCVDSSNAVSGDATAVRFSCSTVAPMASQFSSQQSFTDSACSVPEPVSSSSKRGLKRYVPASGASFLNPGCVDKEYTFFTGGADSKADLVVIEYPSAGCTGDWTRASRVPMGRCVPDTDGGDGGFLITTAPTGTYTMPANPPPDFADWPPRNAEEFKYCLDAECTAPDAAVSLLAQRLGQCVGGEILTCRGDYMAGLVTASPDCAGAVFAVDARSVSTPLVLQPFGRLSGCSSPSAEGLTPFPVPPLVTLSYGDRQCSGRPSRIRFSTPEDCDAAGHRVLNATGTTVTVQTFRDGSCTSGTLVSTRTVADQDCVAGDWARYTSAQSCDVSKLTFVQWAGWPQSNSGVGGCPQEDIIGAAQTAAAFSHIAQLAVLIAALALGLAQ